MTLQDIDQAVAEILNSDDLREQAKIDKRLKYELLNQDKRIVSTAKKLEILWNAGWLEIIDYGRE